MRRFSRRLENNCELSGSSVIASRGVRYCSVQPEGARAEESDRSGVMTVRAVSFSLTPFEGGLDNRRGSTPFANNSTGPEIAGRRQACIPVTAA
jgi:hypothetical protein